MRVRPLCPDTSVAADPHVWIPKDFNCFTKELEHITSSVGDRLLVYRGQANHRWLLESTFVRNCKKILLGIDSPIRPSKQMRERAEYSQALFGVFLLKFGVLVNPSAELRHLEETLGIDPWFEMLKRHQQYPAEDRSAVKGTFFMDWTTKPEVGIFFANCDSDENSIRTRQNDGALFVCDAGATGKTLMRTDDEEPEAIRVDAIIQRMVKAHNEGMALGCPLLFHPPKQLDNLRANNQEAIYWAQMDLASDLEVAWASQEKRQAAGEFIYVKLILPYSGAQEAQDYLTKRGITHSYLYPS